MSPSFRSARMDKLSLVLPKVLRKRGLGTHAYGALAAYHARQWMDGRLPELRDAIRVLRLKDGVLHFSCTHSVAVQECQGVSEELLQFLRVECPFERITDIRVLRD